MSEKRTSLREVWVGGGGDGQRPGLLRSKRIHSKTAEKNTLRKKKQKKQKQIKAGDQLGRSLSREQMGQEVESDS